MTWIITEEMSILQKKCILNCRELTVTKITPETKELGNSRDLTAWAQERRLRLLRSQVSAHLTLLSALLEMEFGDALKAIELRTHLLLFCFSKPGYFLGILRVQPPPTGLLCPLILWPTPCAHMATGQDFCFWPAKHCGVPPSSRGRNWSLWSLWPMPYGKWLQPVVWALGHLLSWAHALTQAGVQGSRQCPSP